MSIMSIKGFKFHSEFETFRIGCFLGEYSLKGEYNFHSEFQTVTIGFLLMYEVWRENCTFTFIISLKSSEFLLRCNVCQENFTFILNLKLLDFSWGAMFGRRISPYVSVGFPEQGWGAVEWWRDIKYGKWWWRWWFWCQSRERWWGRILYQEADLQLETRTSWRGGGGDWGLQVQVVIRSVQVF